MSLVLISMSHKIYVLDAVNYLFRSYHAIGPMTNSKGASTGALFGFIRSVQKIFKDFSPEYFVAVFDGPDNKKSRQKVYAEYKMHRKGAPEDLFPQFDWAYEYCELAGLSTLCVEGVEADDAMGAVATWAAKKKFEVYLCSSDKDLMQLVQPHVYVLQTYKDNLLVDAKKVEEIYGVRPDQIIDYLAIMGDASDQIPGLEGFGPKTASSLLQEFDTLDELLKHPEKVKGEKKQETLRTQKETALLSRKLATIDVHVPIPHDEDYYRVKKTDQEKLSSFYHEMQFHTFLREAPATPSASKKHEGPTDYVLVDDDASFEKLIETLIQAKEICIDTETTSIHPLVAECVGVGFCIEPKKAWYVPCNGKLGMERVKQGLKHLLSHVSVYGHNVKYDYHIFSNMGIEPKAVVFDTILASYLLAPQNRLHNLDTLALERFKKVKIPIEDLIGKGKAEISMKEVPIEKVKDYCCEDVDYTCRLKELFSEELDEQKLSRLYTEVEIPLLPILARMEETGIYLDPDQLKKTGKELVVEVEKMKKKIFKVIGAEFNINSPKQLAEILHSKLGLTLPKGSTRADILERLAEEEPVLQDILDYRAAEKLRSTYIDALIDSIHPITQRIHCTFNQSGTATGRLSCQDPNLQNIPVRTEAGRQIRSCFKPEKRGWSLLGADYSQIELRLLAHFSEDPELLHAFRHGEDIHVHTASLVFGVPASKVTPEMRSQAKTVNFGIIYGQGPYGLSRQLHISMGEASRFIETYFKRYSKVEAYTQSCIAEARKKGYSVTLTGRRRPIPEMNNKNQQIKASAERLAVNTPLQGTAADLIKMAMISIDKKMKKEGLESRMLLQIHDELIFEGPDGEMQDLKALVKHEMEKVISLSVPLEVHVSVGKNWGEC